MADILAEPRQSQELSRPSEPKPVRRRAGIACTACRLRKVRCNVSVVGVPCGNCRMDDQRCQTTKRKTKGYVPFQGLRAKMERENEKTRKLLTVSALVECVGLVHRIATLRIATQSTPC